MDSMILNCKYCGSPARLIVETIGGKHFSTVICESKKCRSWVKRVNAITTDHEGKAIGAWNEVMKR